MENILKIKRASVFGRDGITKQKNKNKNIGPIVE